VPFIRQTRDKRGFEHTFVMHVARPSNGSPRTRVLYVFRSPSSLAVGRKPLDAEVMEALEHTHPDLSFDWNNMTREAVVTRPEPQQRQPQRPSRPRPGAPDQRRTPAGSSASPSHAPAPEHVDDGSLLVTTVGAAEAAQLRQRHHDVLHRIGRRARTPEDRNRLLERAKLLNPDGWEDEGAIRSLAPTMAAECDRILAELPSRRRGRRGGRRRGEPEAGSASPSVIMAQDEESHDHTTDADVGTAGRAHDAGGDAGVGPAEPAAGISSDD
jgi:hypothetical protein